MAEKQSLKAGKIAPKVGAKKQENVEKHKAEGMHKHEVAHKEIPAKKKEEGKIDAAKIEEKKEAQKKPKKPSHKKNVDGKSKTAEMKKAEKTRDKMKGKTHPIFRGRFGKKQFRKKSIKKWQKWRYPRGIDIFFRREDGSVPRIGYRVPKEFRDFHPSGMMEKKVENLAELQSAGKNVVVRIGGTVGAKKRKEIIRKAKEIGVKILN